MKRTLFGILAIGGLALTLLPSVLVFTGAISGRVNTILMAIGMLLWFSTAPFWSRKGE